MIASFTIIAHDYFITEQATNELYVYMRREMRRAPLLGMKQPAPQNSFMGMDTVLVCKYKGQVGRGYKWKLLKDGQVIQSGITDHNGMAYGLDIEFSNGLCTCRPQWFRDTSPMAKKEPDINKRICGVILPTYQIEFDEPDPPPDSPAVASPELSVPLETSDSALEPPEAKPVKETQKNRKRLSNKIFESHIK